MMKAGNYRTVAYCVLGSAAMFSVPFYFRWNTVSSYANGEVPIQFFNFFTMYLAIIRTKEWYFNR